MQNNSDNIQNIGALAKLVYSDRYFENINQDTLIDQNDHVLLTKTYVVRETQGTLLNPLTYPDFFGFQAFLQRVRGVSP